MSFLTWDNQVRLLLNDTFLSFKLILLIPKEKEDAFPPVSCSVPAFLRLSTIEIWTILFFLLRRCPVCMMISNIPNLYILNISSCTPLPNRDNQQ